MTLLKTLTRFGGGGGAAPDVTVATFADLPTTRPDGYLVAVTAQSGLTEVIVRWDDSGGVWLLVSTACAYSVRAAVQWGATPGEWYDTGGVTVETADGATIYDTTYKVVRRWASASSAWVAAEVYAGTIAGLGTIKGDDATPAGWTVTETPGTGTATVTTSSGKLVLATTSGASGASVCVVSFADAGLTSGVNWQAEGLIQITALSGSTSQSVYISVEDGADGYAFGSVRQVGVNLRIGGFFNETTGTDYAAQSENVQDLTTAETLIEVRKIAGRFSVRTGGAAGTWKDLAAATARASANNRIDLVALVFSPVLNAATLTVREWAHCRY
jgi:hypothetical protein